MEPSSFEHLRQWYEERRPHYAALADIVRAKIEILLKKTKINYLGVNARTKTLESFVEKIERTGQAPQEITDFCAVRVVTFLNQDLEIVSKIIRKTFHVHEASEMDSSLSNQIGYRRVHFVCALHEYATTLPELGRYGEIVFEIQIATALEHGFAEKIHALKYKDRVGIVSTAGEAIIEVNKKLIEKFRRNPELLKTMAPRHFEELTAELFEEDGYKVILTRPQKDGGKDLYVYKEDSRAGAGYLVECKRYAPPHKVGVEIARQLYGLIQHERMSGGIIVTTSYFTQGAKDFAATIPYQLYLRDFENLKSWLARLQK